jgi:oxalate decarboxylase/phosphoglucose isomerase-like protein (cupin superfamily)
MSKPHIIDFPKIIDERGNLSYFESNSKIPFEIKRAYWIYDVPGGEIRGEHAYRELEEVIIALSGSFDVILNDGEREYKFTLNRSYLGLYIPKLMWRRIENFSTNSLALIVSNNVYNPEDYIRDYKEFEKIKNLKNGFN